MKTSNKKNKIKFSVLVALLIVPLFIFTTFLPSILSYKGIEYLVSKNLPGAIAIQEAKLSWFKEQVLYGVTYTEKKSKKFIEVPTLQIKASLFDLLFNKKRIKEIRASQLNAVWTIERNPNLKVENKKKSLQKGSKDQGYEKPLIFQYKLPFFGKINIENAQLVLHSPDQEEVHLKDILFNCHMVSTKGPLLINLNCETFQGQLSGAVELNCEMGGFNNQGRIVFIPFDRDPFFLSPNGYFQLNAQVTNSPTIGFNHLLEYYNPKLKGLLSPLLGDSLNLGTQIHIIKGKSNVNLIAQAPNLDLKFSGSLLGKHFILNEPSTCSLNIRPDFIQALASQIYPEAPFNISRATVLKFQMDRLVLPLDFKNFNFNSLSCNARFHLGAMNFKGNPLLDEFQIKQVKGIIDTFDIAENVALHLKIFAQDHGFQTQCKIDGQISKFLDLHETSSLNQLHGYFIGNFSDVPTRFVTLFSKQKAIYNELIGSSFDADLTFKGSLLDGELALGLSSPGIQIKNTLFHLKDKKSLNLSSPTKVALLLSPELVQLFAPKAIALHHPIEMDCDFSKAQFRLLKQDQKNSHFDFSALIKPFEGSYDHSDPFQFSNTKIQVTAHTLQNTNFNLESKLNLPKTLDNKGFAKQIDLNFNAKELNFYDGFKNSRFEGQFIGDQWNTSVSAIYVNKSLLKITEPIVVQYLLKSYAVGDYQLDQPCLIHAELAPTNINPSTLSLGSINTQAHLVFQDLNIKKGSKSYSFFNLEMPIVYKGPQNIIEFDAINSLNNIHIVGSVRNFLQQNKLNTNAMQIAIKGRIENLSSDYLSLLTKKNINFLNLIGPSFSLDLDSNLQKVCPSLNNLIYLRGDLNYQFNAKNLSSDSKFIFDKDLEIAKPININLSLSQNSYNEIFSVYAPNISPSLQLVDSSEFKITLSHFKLSSPFLNKIQKNKMIALDGKFLTKSLDTTEGEFKKVKGSFKTDNLYDSIYLSLSAQGASASLKNGSVLFSASLNNCIDPHTNLINPLISGSIESKLTNIPSSILHDLFSFKAKHLCSFASDLGSTFNMDLSSTLKEGRGPLQVAIQSESLSSKASFYFDKNHLRLNEDLNMGIQLTPEIAARFLKNLNPMVASAVNAQKRIDLKFDKKDFYFPLFSKDTETAKTLNGTLYLNKVDIQETECLKNLFSILGFNAPTHKFTVWFTPTHFHIQGNTIRTDRFDFLIDGRLHLALWGSNNISNKEGSYFLALPQSILYSAFNLEKLPENYMFQIPLHSEVNALKTDWSNVSSQLNMLGLSSAVFSSTKKNKGSNHDLDNVLDIFSKTQASGPTPELREPLPWTAQEIKPLPIEGVNPEPKQNIKSQQEQNKVLYNLLHQMKKQMTGS